MLETKYYKRLDSLEVPELEVIWIKIMPKKLPRKVSCILVACVYYTQHTDYSQMRYHLIMGIDTMIRKHPECGVIITGVPLTSRGSRTCLGILYVKGNVPISLAIPMNTVYCVIWLTGNLRN